MSAKTKSFWSRYDVRLAAAAVAVGLVGLAATGAAVWAGLMIWNRDFRFRFTMWYKAWVLAGLVVVVLAEYPVSAGLNVPPSWVGLVVMLGAALLALAGSRPTRNRTHLPSHWR